MFSARTTGYYLRHPSCPRCGAEVAAHTPSCPYCSTPLLVDRYRLVRVIAHTPAGSLFEAIDMRYRRRCTVKRMSPVDGPDPYVVIDDELAGLEHMRGLPCVPRFYRTLWADNECFLVLPATRGAPLRELVCRTWDAAEVMAFLDGGLELLARMHRRGLALRNLTPSNLIYTHDGHILLIDYGQFMPALTETFAAPEMGVPEAASERSDLYHLGATAYSLLAGGQPPSQHRGIVNPGAAIPDLLAKVLKHLLHRDQSRRPHRAQDARDQLRGWWSRRLAMVIALLCLAVIVGAAVALTVGESQIGALLVLR
jgi:serine/threonine protein kinase